MTWMVVISLALLLTYTLAVCLSDGRIPNTLSESVLTRPKSFQIVWTLVIVAMCFMLVPHYLERTGENTQFLAFFAVVGLCLVGTAPLAYGMSRLALKVHETGAIVCGVCSQIVLIFNEPWLLLTWIPWVAAFVLITKDSKWRTLVFWAEMVCFTDTFAYCLMK